MKGTVQDLRKNLKSQGYSTRS